MLLVDDYIGQNPIRKGETKERLIYKRENIMKEWTEKETELFIQMYAETPTIELINIFKRSKGAIFTKANKLGIKKTIRADGLQYVYKEEELAMIECSKNHSIPEIKKIFNRDYCVIKEILIKNNCEIISSNYWWNAEEEKFLKENFETGNPEYMSNFLNKKWRTITKKAREMGMRRHTRNGVPHKDFKIMTEYEKNFILDNYEHMSISEISKHLNRSDCPIVNFCEKNNLNVLKLRKNPKDYTDSFLLEELKRVSKFFGRCPTGSEIQRDLDFPSVDIYYDRFGTFTNACELAGLIPNVGSFGTMCYSKAGDKCYSIAEQIITDYFIDNGIDYVKEYEYYHIIPLLNCGIVMDWWIENSIVVEYFGLQKFEKYELKTEMKQSLCKENNIRIISLFPENMKCLDKIFHEFINKNP
jgi:hypothetical protein